jgi:hypothetical protein
MEDGGLAVTTWLSAHIFVRAAARMVKRACRPKSQPNKRNVNHKRQDSTIKRIGCPGRRCQVGLKRVARRKTTSNRNRCAGPIPEKGS